MFDQTLSVPGFDVRSANLNLSGGAVNILRPDLHRVGLFIANYTGNNLFVSNDNTVSSAQGYWVVPNNTSYEWYWERHGAILTLAWWVAAFQAGTKMSYTELLFYSGRLK